MYYLNLVLFAFSGFLIAYGLILRVKGIMNKAVMMKTNQSTLGTIYKLLGLAILGYLILTYKTQDLVWGLISFFISAFAIISWILLARRCSIR